MLTVLFAVSFFNNLNFMTTTTKQAIFWALLAAVLYAFSAPLSKILLQQIHPVMLAGLLYVGAGLGMGGLYWGGVSKRPSNSLSLKDWPYVTGMIVLDIAAPILLLGGLLSSSAAAVSLINNFEIVATALIAGMLFKECISPRLWLAIGLITLGSMLLCIKPGEEISWSVGALFVLGACVCWGLENNCTRMIANKNPLEIVTVKGLCAGSGSLCCAYVLGGSLPAYKFTFIALIVGFVCYGLSIFFYVLAQRYLGAAKTSAFYASAPFAGVLFSLLIFREWPHKGFWVALGLMVAGAYLAAADAANGPQKR